MEEEKRDVRPWLEAPPHAQRESLAAKLVSLISTNYYPSCPCAGYAGDMGNRVFLVCFVYAVP